MEHRRLAAYWTPPPGPLADALAAWLGWDPGRGAPVPHPDVPGLPRPVAEITEAPRRYGPHATLAPPLRLAPGRRPEEVEAAVERLARRLAPARADGLRLGRIGGFVALLPEGDPAALDALAAEAVRALDPLRARPEAAEIEKRRAAGLDPREEALLLRWGYPYVMERFRFHVTLSGPLPESGAGAEARAVEAALGPWLGPLLPRPFVLDALSLMGEGPDGRFRVLGRHPLRG